MLLQFTFKNYKCFRDEVILNLQASTGIELEDTIIVDSRDGERILPVAVLYGPNAGGKSTVLEALWHLISKVMYKISIMQDESNKKTNENQYSNITKPYLLDDFSFNEATEFNIIFRHKEYEFNYFVSLLENVILNERLTRREIGGSKEREVFFRTESNVQKCKELEFVSTEKLNKTMPFLSHIEISHDVPIINDVINWFRSCMFINYGKGIDDNTILLFKDTNASKVLLKMLKEMDISIDDIIVNTDDEGKIDSIVTKREINNNNYSLDFFEESSGTIKMVSLIPRVISALTHGSLLIVDEIDAKVHPKLLEHIIKLFKDREINKKSAQLLFTSHSVTIMTNAIFRRDEIWFVAKNKNHSSDLYSLIELRDEKGELIRKNAKYNKQYMEGRYGSDPYFEKIVNWESIHNEQ